MPDAQGKSLGNDEMLYVAAAAPATLTDESLYTLVGLVINNPFAIQGEAIRAANKQSARFQGAVSGDASYNITAEAHRKNIPDAGQELVRDASISGDPLWWLITTGVTGDECKHGSGVVTNYAEPSARNEFKTMTATIEGDGAPTFAAVPA